MEEMGEHTWDVSRILDDMISICRRAEGARVHVCHQQCSYLVQKFQELVDYLGRRGSELVHCKQAVGEIVHLMAKGWHLIDSCTSSDWIWNAVLKEENRMGFQDIVHDLLLSISYINDILSEPGIPTEERSSLNAMADRDREHLTKMVQGAWEARRRTFFQAACWRKSSKPLTKFLYDLLRNPRGTPLGDVFMLSDRHMYLFLDPAHLKQGRLIGRGAYGTVHQATWLGKTVAMKEYSIEDPTFVRELAALIFLRHPNIVRMIGYTRESNYSLVMERTERDLHHLIRDIVEKQRGPPFTLDVALDIILQIAKGMEFLHSKDVVHLDLKTANILVNLPKDTSAKLFTAKVSDFGLAETKFISATTRQSGVGPVGTIIYMAPEVWDGESRYTKKADVYSFAMTCYEVLTGKMPFEGSSGPAVAFFGTVTHSKLRPTLPPGLPDHFKEFLQLCWHGNPAVRPSFTQICKYLASLKNAADLPHLNSKIDIGNDKSQAVSSSTALPAPISSARDPLDAGDYLASLENTRTRMQTSSSPRMKQNY